MFSLEVRTPRHDGWHRWDSSQHQMKRTDSESVAWTYRNQDVVFRIKKLPESEE